MLRLRTTVTLSVLLLMLGVAGTGWLTTLTAGGYAPSPRFAASGAPAAPRLRAAPRRVAHATRDGHRAVLAQRPRAWYAPAAIIASVDQLMATPVAPELQPLTTPSDDSLTWEQLRGHLDGRVLLQVNVDGSGRVRGASVAQSSGDELLDTHALRSVWRWRFAVPKDSPAGLSGEVPVRYASTDAAR